MHKNGVRKRSSGCNNNIHQTNRPKRRRLKGPSIDAFRAKESKFAKLPSNCVQHILSFMHYEKVSQMRQVCKNFNKTGTTLLDKGRRELESRLQREIIRAEKMVLFNTNERSSSAVLRFLKDLHEAINNCTITYAFHVDFFMAGKLLDEANCLLKNFNSWTVLPYFPQHIYDQRSHPLLCPIIAHSQMAHQHFKWKLLGKLIYYDGKACYKRFKRNDSELKVLKKRNKKKITNINYFVKYQKQKIDCGNEMSRELIKLISKLNENVLDLTEWANKVDEKVDRRMIKRMARLNNDRNNCLFKSSTPSSSSLGPTKLMGIHGSKPPNLATLPSSCLQSIVSCFNCDKMAQLRIVCKSFNKVCKQKLNQECEKLKQKLEFQIKYHEHSENNCAMKLAATQVNAMKDLRSLLQQCENNYKCGLGTDYYFAAGKILDEAKRLYYNELLLFYLHPLRKYNSRPHCSLFGQMDLVNKSTAHFKFNIVPKYFPSTQNRNYVPDFITSTGDASNFDKESRQLTLEETEKLIEETNAKIKKQNDKNRKFVTILSSLKKKVNILNNDVFSKINLLREPE